MKILCCLLIVVLLGAWTEAYRVGTSAGVGFGRVNFQFQRRFASKGSMTEVETKDLGSVSTEHKQPQWLNGVSSALLSLAPALSVFFLSDPAFADGNSYGILAGRTASLLHPITNVALFGTSIYAAYLGLQWRRLRDLGEELKALNTELPKLATTQARFPLNEKIEELKKQLSTLSAEKDVQQEKINAIQKDLTALNNARDLDNKYSELTNTRKSLLSANLRDKHHLTGSILLGAGVTVAILGAFNTYMRAGRLFPGPHLYAGMGIVILWALATSLVPAMQKGQEWARVSHIALNVINIALFAWQLPTGFEITLKVLEKTSWP